MNVISPIHPQDGSGTGTNPTTGSGTGLPSATGLNNMFLQLLVAQLQNQSPLDPMDPSQFVGQLAEFSELSEVTQIEQTLQEIVPLLREREQVLVRVERPEPSLGDGSIRRNLDGHFSRGAAAMTSSAVAAAQAAIPHLAAPAASILNQQIQGVF